jgi:hypothetical protein
MVSYVTDFVCTYHLMDDPEDADDSDKLFKLQFLQAFNYDANNSNQPLEDYFDTINIITTELYNSYKNNELIKKLIAKVKTTESNYNNNENDDFIIFQLCFSYSYFYITHKILCLIINTNNSSNTNNTFNYQELLKIINRIK